MSGQFGNSFVKTIILSPFHFLLGSGCAIITVKGRRTGKLYSTPINVVKDGETLTAISLRTRTWWRNLRQDEPALLRVSGKQHSVRGEVIEGRDQVVEGLRRYFQQNPWTAKYFGLKLDSTGQPPDNELQRVAEERVIIRLGFREDS